jgi:hypothetical protein
MRVAEVFRNPHLHGCTPDFGRAMAAARITPGFDIRTYRLLLVVQDKCDRLADCPPTKAPASQANSPMEQAD